MTDRTKTNGARWAAVIWAVGVLAVLAALPLVANGRLPARLATHWGDGAPDGSMPLWAAALFPALIWAVLVLSLAFAGRRGGSPSGAWVGAVLLSGGVFLAGTQASIVRANLDRADWKDAGSVGTGVVITAMAAVTAGILGRLAGRRAALPATPGQPAGGDVMEIPAGERRVWLARTSNPWLHLTAALTGLVAVAAAVAAAGGLLIGMQWALITPFAIASLLVLACSSVQARVTEAGLEVSFGPLGWPVRRWAARDIVSARSETRSPAQVGGWGYRLSGLGTTVMLRSGECLVIHPSKGPEFAVSVDDAERGAALLNALCSNQQTDA
ncbi:DUF1648 domain-containing protein [Streptomyces antimicrobicus]|uniref:DUF1648 domain-containing protein n=1 Tax=Streptomyces antimicrobicus TaxID=2883108 RepID=A0ABS8BBN1_9ACTN|nr:DUF1648 domain-containing protein [Streptomyces antimicrobicus]MCB5182002.1 DUF1648 domain-containing protein [Streptomyces antimicrobicus]